MLAGITWTTVGIALIIVALGWLVSIHHHIAVAAGSGIIAGLVVYRFGFSRIAAANLVRIKALATEKDNLSLFAFQKRSSYYIVAIMMSLGYGLRHSPLPRIYLVPVYGAIGLALLFSSFQYYQNSR